MGCPVSASVTSPPTEPKQTGISPKATFAETPLSRTSSPLVPITVRATGPSPWDGGGVTKSVDSPGAATVSGLKLKLQSAGIPVRLSVTSSANPPDDCTVTRKLAVVPGLTGCAPGETETLKSCVAGRTVRVVAAVPVAPCGSVTWRATGLARSSSQAPPQTESSISSQLRVTKASTRSPNTPSPSRSQS